MSEFKLGSEPKSMQIEAVVIRANGKREDLGVISYWNRNPLLRVWFWVRNIFRR